MDFNYFLSQINTLKQAKTGGLASQFKLAPKERLKYSVSDILKRKPKRASVLALFYPGLNGETLFLLTQRPEYPGVHSAQISFPGGKFDKHDKDLIQTALRETHEEVGINPESIRIFREMTETYIPPSNFLVTPFMGYTTEKPFFKTNHEVEAIIEINLDDLLNEQHLLTKKMTTSYMENIDVPCFKLNGCIVWGATAMMLSEIKDLLTKV